MVALTQKSNERLLAMSINKFVQYTMKPKNVTLTHCGVSPQVGLMYYNNKSIRYTAHFNCSNTRFGSNPCYSSWAYSQTTAFSLFSRNIFTVVFMIFSHLFPQHLSQYFSQDASLSFSQSSHYFPGGPWLLLAVPDGPWLLLTAPWVLLAAPGFS